MKPRIQLAGPYRRPNGIIRSTMRVIGVAALAGWVFGIVLGLYWICRY